MRLTDKLLSLIHGVIKKDPERFIALRLRYSTGAMTWRVKDAVLTTTVSDGPGHSLSIDLTQYTISGLVGYLASQAGYSVVYVDSTELSGLSARILLDATGDLAVSNGDAIYGYTNVAYAYLEAMAVELDAAETQVTQMVRQMSTKTASDVWLDEIGGYYGILRLDGELDSSYGPRIIAEVLRPRGNNVAIEAAIKTYTGQSATVTDVVVFGTSTPGHDGSISYDGTHLYNATAKPQYGLFDVEYGYDLINGGSITDFAAIVRSLIQRLRDAGTHLRALTLTGSALVDSFTGPADDGDVQSLAVAATLTDTLTAPSDAFATSAVISDMSDTLTAPSDSVGISVTYNVFHNGARTYNGSVPYSGGTTVVEAL
jgi:hypothetical protein